MAEAPAKTRGNFMFASTGGLVASSTITSSTTVATEERTAPLVAGQPSAGSSRARAPILAIVAELEANPDASPARGSPTLGPSRRTAICPSALTDISSTTIFHITRGLIAANGPTYLFGTSGNTTTTAAAKISASRSSLSGSTVLTK